MVLCAHGVCAFRMDMNTHIVSVRIDTVCMYVYAYACSMCVDHAYVCV